MIHKEVVAVVHSILVSNWNCKAPLDSTLLEMELEKDLELDSFARVDLQLAIEDRFNFLFDPVNSNLEHVFHTVGTLVEYIETHRA